MWMAVLAGFGLIAGGIGAISAAQPKVPSSPVAEGKAPAYYNPFVRRSLRNAATFAHFTRHQHTITAGTPDLVDSHGMTRSNRESWARSLERVKAYNASRASGN